MNPLVSGQLQYLNIYRFSKIKLTENNAHIDLTATFSGNSDCNYSISYPLPTNPCWAGRIGTEETNTPILKQYHATGYSFQQSHTISFRAKSSFQSAKYLL